MTTAIKVASSNLDFYYGDFKALEDISINFELNRVTASSDLPAAESPRTCVASTA